MKKLLIYVIFCVPVLASYAQSSAWKSARYGKISLSYPPTWHMTKETRGSRSLVTLTPDSMQQLSMRMIEIFELPLEGHSFADFKNNYVSMLKARSEDPINITKTDVITFKDHKAVYAELIRNSLPNKLYGIDGGTNIYVFLVLPRRYSTIADPAMERDEKAIMNSIKFNR